MRAEWYRVDAEGNEHRGEMSEEDSRAFIAWCSEQMGFDPVGMVALFASNEDRDS